MAENIGGAGSGGESGNDGESGSGGAHKRSHSEISAGTAGEEVEEDTLTMQDVLNEQINYVETARAVLGDADNKNCSYDKGYVKRQPLFACLTCSPASDPNFKPAGVCLACSLVCHDGHELVELYTKRNFRCDCGNQKFPSTTCKLRPYKDEFNDNNCYNHNFTGLYCNCNRPYPEPEGVEGEDEDMDEEDEEMIQCVICEDWFHSKHTNTSHDFKNDEYSEFICDGCTKKCDFLKHYGQFRAVYPSADKEKMDIACAGDDKSDEGLGASPPHPSTSNISLVRNDVDDGSSQDSGTIGLNEPSDEEISQGSLVCLLDGPLAVETVEFSGGSMWKTGWRTKLCKCAKCLEKYENLKVSFLVDYEDTLAAYEAKGKKFEAESEGQEREQDDDLLQSFISKLDHVTKIEVIHGYNQMKEELQQFLRGILESGRVVTSQDITSFFTALTNKRRKTDSGVYIPHNCR